MSRRNKDVRALWGGRFAQEAAADRNRREFEQYKEDLQKKIDERAAQLEQESVERLAEQKLQEEDPEGYAYEKEQQELEKAPKTLGNYFKNWWASHGRKMNDFQIQDYQGYIDRANQWRSLAERTQESWDIEDKLKNIDSQLSQLSNTEINSENVQEVSEAIKQLQLQKQTLSTRLKELAPAVEALKSYAPEGVSGAYQDLKRFTSAVGGSIFGGIDNAVFGKTSQSRDELTDITRHTSGMFASDRSRAEQKMMLNMAMRAYDDKIKEWQQGVDANIKDRESYDKVDRWFQKKEENSKMDIFDSDTWLYGMPGLLAGSTSGMSKILPAMITGAVTGAAAAATGGIAGAAIVAAGAVPAFGLNYGAGVGENNAEVAMAYNERLEEYLQNAEGREEGKSLYDDIVAEGRKKLHVGKKDMTDKEVFEQYRKGAYTINNAAANKKMRELAIGIENQMQDDMAATTWSAGIETVLQVMPIGGALNVGKAIRYQMLKTAGRREALRGVYENLQKASGVLGKLGEGYEVGGIVSPVAGALYAPIHAAVSPAFKRMGKIAKGVLDDISRTASMVDDIPGRALTKKFMRGPKVRYMKDITGRWIASGIEEAIEEGKQNISANRYKYGEYTSEKIKSIGETILDDFLAGSKSAALLLGMPFEGLLSETDRKTLQEMKGGLILGGLQTSIVNVAQSIAPYRAEQKATTAIANAILLDKAVKLDNYNKAKIYAEASKSSSAYQNILNAFDRLRKMNEDEHDSTGEYGIAPERITEEINRFGEVAKMANDAYTIKQAEAQGIKPNTGEYNEFVGAKQMAMDEVTSAQEVVNAASKNFSDVQTELTEAILTERLKNVATVGEQNTAEEKPAEEAPNPIAQHTSVEDYNQMQNVAKYTALLRRKQQLELGIANAEHRNHTKIKSILQEQLENTNDQIDNLKKVIQSYVKDNKPVDIDDVESIEHGLVLNKQDHDKLSEAYRQVFVADQDLDLAMAQYERVVGKAYLNGKAVEPNEKVNWGEEFDNVTFVGGDVKNVIREIKETIKDDDDLASSIDEDFEDRTDDNGEEVISEQEAEDLEHTPPVENDPVKEFTEDNKKQKEQPKHTEGVKTERPRKAQEVQEQPSVQIQQPSSNDLIGDIDKIPEMSLDDLFAFENSLEDLLEDPSISDSDRKKVANAINTIDRKLIKAGYNKPSKAVWQEQMKISKQMDARFTPTEQERKKANEILEKSERRKKGDKNIVDQSAENKPVEPIQKPTEPVSQPEPAISPETSQNASEQPKTAQGEDTVGASPVALDYLLTGGPGTVQSTGYLLHAIAAAFPEISDQIESIRNQKLDQINPNPETFKDDTTGALDQIKAAVQSKYGSKGAAILNTILQNSTGFYNRDGQQLQRQIDELEVVKPKDQQDVLDAIKKKAEESAKYVKEVTSDYYLIDVEGTNVKMRRVHSIMPQYWIGGDKRETGAFMPALQVGNVFDNLARIFLGDKRNLRHYEQNKATLIDTLWNEPASHKDSPNDPGIKDMAKLLYKDIYSSKEEFANTIDDLYNIGRTYEDLGWELSTESIVWYSKLSDGYVAGETDMLAVDRDGNVHIIDFKTAKARRDGNSPFTYYDVAYTYSIGDELEKERLSLNEDDFKAGPRGKGLSKNARAFIKKVRMRGIDIKLPYEQRRQIAERNRHLKVVWDSTANNGEGEAVLKYMASDYTQYGGTFRQTHIYKGEAKITKEDEYSDQLTAYKNLVSRNLANVVDLEVLGFAATYEHDEKNVEVIHRITDPMRIKVSDSEEMQDMFNAEGEAPIVEPEPPVAPIAEENKEAEQQIEKQQLSNETKGLSVDNDPQVVQPSANVDTPSTPQNVAPMGHSNLNPNAVHNLHPQLEKDIIFDPDFINEVIQHGSIDVYTQVVKDRNGEFPSMYVDITYKGKEYKHIYVYADPALFDKLKTLEKNKQPGQKIVATAASRTEGEIMEDTVRPIKDSGLLSVPVERLTFTADGGFGFAKNNQLVSFVGDNPNTQDVIYTFTKAGHDDGKIYYLKKLPRNEGNRKDQIVPVEVGRKTLGKDADFIIDCIKNVDTLRTSYIATVKGKSVNTGISKKDLLSLIMPYIDSMEQSGKVYALLRDSKIPSVFHVVQNQNVILSVDIRNQKSIEDFKKALGGLSIEQDNNILARKLGGKEANAVFKAAEKFFRNNTDGVTEFTVSDSITLSADDFKNGGISGLAWYIKNGILVSDYAGLQKPLMSINDIGYIQSEKPKDEKVDPIVREQDVPKKGGFSLDDIAIANWGGKKGQQNKRKTAADEGKKLLTAEDIKKHLRPILGDLVDDPNIINVVSTLSNDPRTKDACVVGKASSDSITLYGDAFIGVDYHEAFHRIFELFVPRSTREALYQKVAKMHGIDLSKSTKENNYEGHRQVAEWLADKYMDYRRFNINTGIEWVDRIVNFVIDAVRALRHIGDFRLYKLFLEINSGKYKNRRNASKENVQRFDEMFGELNYEIHQQEFKHIANDPMYEDCKNSAFYCILLGQDVDVSGATVQNTQITRAAFQRGAERLKASGFDVFGTDVEPTEKTAAQLAMTELMVKFDAVADDFAAMMANISTDYRKIMQQEGRDDLDGGESSSSYDENFFKWSYEFNKFDKTTSRVKFFFATLVDLQYADDQNSTFKYATNGIGLPQLIPMNYVFNEVLSHLWDVDTIDEVIYRLSNLAMQDPMYAQILTNLRKVINGVTNEDGTTNADNEALLAQLMTTIRSNRHTFMLLRSVESAKGVYDLVLQRSDADYNARVFPLQWSQVLAKGGSETLKLDKYGRVVFNPNNREAANTFSRISRLLNEIKTAVSSGTGNVKVSIPQYVYPEYEYEDSIGNRNVSSVYFQDEVVEDIKDPKGCEKVKAALVDAFNRIGINIHKEEFEYMLTHKYGSSDWTALQQMMQSTDQTDSIGSFIYFLDNIVRNGKLNVNAAGEFSTARGKNIQLDQVFSEIAFVKELGNWKYEYRHAHDQLSVLATGGNRFYEISDNDYMSDVLRNCNKRGKWFDELKQDAYNYTVGEFDNFGDRHIYGSVTLQQLTNDPDLKLALKHFIGFKTDRRGDEGSDYFEISRREDYLSKVGILENDGMISLTLSDKKKYCYITGVKLPGIDYTQMRKANGNFVDLDLAKYLISVPDNVASAVYTIQQRQDVVDQFISYAKAEYESILRNGVRLNDGHAKVANFDTKEQSVRFSSLLGVWETTFDKNGKPVGEDYISFNDKNKSWEENLAIAEAYFFDRSIDEQRALIGRLLSIRTDKELEQAEKLGLIKRRSGASKHMSYQNVGLNNTVITAIRNSYIAANIGLTVEEAESLAVVMYINDISNKAIMSGQEMERLFSGNPAFYKWTYEDGKLIDRTVDELKRLGGLGSTGVNNFRELSNLPLRYKEGKYNCAEVDNEMIASPQYEDLKASMYEGVLRDEIIQRALSVAKQEANKRHLENLQEIRSDKELDKKEKDRQIAYENDRFVDEIQQINEEITQSIDSQSVEELEKNHSLVASEARKIADNISDMYTIDKKRKLKGIDVADGGAYISDEMCEALLRMEGAYSDDIQGAFRILRGEVESDYLGKIDAYQKVMTSVIGNQKYTAFGRRLQNGNSVPYYHKMALFPIFDCIATGKMRNIFDKMKEQKIDMLLVNSAVKVGSQGSKPINWSEFRQDEDPSNEDNFKGDIANQNWKPQFKDAFSFDTYECEFDYLRKQLNTDPKEEDLLRMGTQMQKIVFSNLMPGREYTTQNGEKIVGKKLLERIMHSSNELSNIGVDKVNKRFFVTNENGELLDIEGNVIKDETDQYGKVTKARNSSKRVLDIEKFSNEVRKMMSDRGADKNIMKALEIVTTAGTNEKRLRVPLGAISNAGWLESVLISELNKEIVDVNTPGAFFIQRSAWAMEGMKMYDGKTAVKGDKSARSLYNGKPLKMVNEEGSMDCVLSLDFFRHILPKVESDEYELDEDGNYVYQRGPNGSYTIDKYGNPVPKKKMRDMTFDEARAWLIKKGIIGENAKANIVAYRIPTQAQSSIHALRCVDVLPVVRDTVILPQEFTKITGSDFDIDKLGLSMLNYDKHGKSDFEEGSEKYHQNQLIKDYITLLIDPKSQHILHRPIDNDTDLLKGVLAEIEQSSGTQEMPYGFYSLSTQTERKDDYITGKIGIGPFALNNNNHILTMLYGVKFKDFDGSIMTELGLNDLSGNRDQDGESIMSWLSALINAHVDIAKDPYISRLNVGPFTYNLVNTLIRTGFGKKTFYLTTQPIMKELAEAYNRAGSLYMQDSNKSVWKLQQEAVEETAKNRFENIRINDWSFDELAEGVSNLEDKKYKPTINKYIKALFDKEKFEFSNGAKIEIDGETIDLSAEQCQLLVYLAYVQMDPYAQSVSNLVKFSKIDTKKHGKSYIEQQVFWKGFNDLFYNPKGTGLFEETGMRRMAEESYILLKTDNAISMTKAILKDQFLQSSNAFDNAIPVVLKMIGKPESKSADLWTSIANTLSAAVKSEFINNYAKKLPQYSSTYMRDLISESEDDLEFTQEANSNRLKVVGNPKYDLKSYIGGAVTMKFVQDGENREHTFNIIGYDDQTNELIVDYKFKREHTGSIHIAGGKNTIYDRFMNLYLDLKDDPVYRDMLDIAGEPVNYLLKSLTVGKTFTYTKPSELAHITKHEAPDTYPTAKFVKLFNALDQNGPEANYIIDAWDQLLHDEAHPKLKRFAEDLVIYSFITSGDQGGFTKFFKQVPLSWRIESGYADHIYDKLQEFKTQELSAELIEDAILNNWFDNQFVPTYQLATDGKSNFITYYNNSPSTGIARANYPTVAAALRQEKSGSLTPTIETEDAPLFMKIPRRREKQARDSQRRYTVFRRISYGMQKSQTPIVEKDNQDRIHVKEQWIHYPIYVKVEPKGNLLTQNYLITEYMREDSTNKEYAPNQDNLRGLYKIGDFISQSTIEQYKPKYGEMLTQMIQDMNYQDVFEDRFASNEADFDKALRITQTSDNPKNYQMQSGGANGADTVWGEIAKEFGITDQNHWYYQEKTPNGNKEISQQDYEEGRYKVAEAAKMNWGYQYKTMKDSRLIRNWAQVKYADSVFAIGHLVNTGEKLFPNQQDDTRTALVPAVQGGTGYAVGMAILNKVPVYVFDQERNQWFVNIDGEWKRVDTPVLTERFAGIGTRQINDAGKQAIRDVFNKTFNKQEQQAEEDPTTLTEEEKREADQAKKDCLNGGE